MSKTETRAGSSTSLTHRDLDAKLTASRSLCLTAARVLIYCADVTVVSRLRTITAGYRLLTSCCPVSYGGQCARGSFPEQVCDVGDQRTSLMIDK